MVDDECIVSQNALETHVSERIVDTNSSHHKFLIGIHCGWSFMAKTGEQPVGCYPRWRRIAQHESVTAPFPFIWAAYEASTNRIQYDIACQFAKIALLLHQYGLITSLHNMPDQVMTTIVVSRIRTVQLPHALTEIAFGSLNEHVIMIRHQAKGVNDKMKSSTDALSFFKPGKMIHPVAKDTLTSVAAASDVIKSAGKFESERSGHLRNLAGDHLYALSGRRGCCGSVRQWFFLMIWIWLRPCTNVRLDPGADPRCFFRR